MQEESVKILILDDTYTEMKARLYAMIEAEGYKIDDMVVFGGTKGYSGSHLDFLCFDELVNIKDIQEVLLEKSEEILKEAFAKMQQHQKELAQIALEDYSSIIEDIKKEV